MSLGENYFATIIKRSLILVALVLAIILAVSLALSKEPKPLMYGLLFGSIINILNFRLMYLSTKKAMSLNPAKAQRHATTNYFIRYITYGLVLIVASKASYINLFTTIMGFFVIKIVILSDALYETIRRNK